MPWCDTCDRLVDDEEVVDGHCPRCDTDISASTRPPLPWRFRLMIGATVVYLGYRTYQVIGWISH
jgi:uncharacterized paraquat-inducible protein A